MAIATQPLQGTYVVADPDHSSVGFTVTHMKVSSFRATFDEIKARFLGPGGRPSARASTGPRTLKSTAQGSRRQTRAATAVTAPQMRRRNRSSA